MFISGYDPDNLPDDMPEEVKLQIRTAKRAYDQAMMSAEAKAHTIERFVDELNEDQMVGFSELLDGMARAPKLSVIYWQGRVESLLVERHGLCPSCHVNHDKEAQIQMSQDNPNDDLTVTQTPNPEVSAADEMTRFDRELHLRPQYAGYEWLPQTLEVMKEYNLDDTYEQESKLFIGFRCQGCGLDYTTLADRMLKPADECHGCFLKSAHG